MLEFMKMVTGHQNSFTDIFVIAGLTIIGMIILWQVIELSGNKYIQTVFSLLFVAGIFVCILVAVPSIFSAARLTEKAVKIQNEQMRESGQRQLEELMGGKEEYADAIDSLASLKQDFDELDVQWNVLREDGDLDEKIH